MPQAVGLSRRGMNGIAVAAFCVAQFVLAGSSKAEDANRPRSPMPSKSNHRRVTKAPNLNVKRIDDRVRIVQRGSSKRSTRKSAINDLPLGKFTAKNRKRAEELLKSAAIFRALPTMVFEVDPHVYKFFVSYPDVAVSVWRVMGISEFQMWQTGRDEYEADGGEGSYGVIDVLYRGAQDNVILCRGVFKSPLLAKPIEARALFHLKTAYLRDENGKIFVKHRANLYVSLPSNAVRTVAKLVSPVSNLILDRNFKETSLFLHMMALAMARQPGWVEQVADRLDGVLEIRKSQLVELTDRVHTASRQRSRTLERASQTAPQRKSPQPIQTASTESPSLPATAIPPATSKPTTNEDRDSNTAGKP